LQAHLAQDTIGGAGVFHLILLKKLHLKGDFTAGMVSIMVSFEQVGGYCNASTMAQARLSKRAEGCHAVFRASDVAQGSPFLAGIEKLVNQVLFVSDVPCQQIPYKQIRGRMFPV
jgi:hypothetical protein